jgi:hypothetical protein
MADGLCASAAIASTTSLTVDPRSAQITTPVQARATSTDELISSTEPDASQRFNPWGVADEPLLDLGVAVGVDLNATSDGDIASTDIALPLTVRFNPPASTIRLYAAPETRSEGASDRIPLQLVAAFAARQQIIRVNAGVMTGLATEPSRWMIGPWASVAVVPDRLGRIVIEVSLTTLHEMQDRGLDPYTVFRWSGRLPLRRALDLEIGNWAITSDGTTTSAMAFVGIHWWPEHPGTDG